MMFSKVWGRRKLSSESLRLSVCTVPCESGCVSGRCVAVALEQFECEQLRCEPMFQSDSEHWQGPSLLGVALSLYTELVAYA